jgi:putative peptidoglycan lipid II flippase
MLPAIFGSSVAQVNVLVGGIIASMLGVGKISLLYYSDRLMEFPLGLFSIAIATVTLPQLSRQHARQSMQEFSQIIDWSLKLVFLIALPSAVGLVVLAEPLVATIFFGGEFSAYDVRMTALSLQAFSLGLIGFSLVKILAPAYFAREDTRTPVRIGLFALAVNFVLSVVLAYGLTKAAFEGTHAGLALATSVAAIVNAWLLYRGLRGDRVLSHAKGWSRLLMQFAAANVLMTVSLLLLNRNLDWWLGSSLVEGAGRGARTKLLCGGV